MNIKYTSLFLIIASIAFFTSCSDKTTPSDPDDGGSDVCDDLSYVTYNDNVKAIIDASCATDYCHGGAGAGNVYLADYAETKTIAEQDRFLKAIKHESGASSMPKNGTKLSDGEIAILECWIVNGFKEN